MRRLFAYQNIMVAEPVEEASDRTTAAIPALRMFLLVAYLG